MNPGFIMFIGKIKSEDEINNMLERIEEERQYEKNRRAFWKRFHEKNRRDSENLNQ